MIILTGKILHQVHGEVLVSNIQDKVWSSLINSLRHVGLIEQVVNLVGISCVVLVHQVKWVPFPVVANMVRL